MKSSGPAGLIDNLDSVVHR